MGRLLTLIVLVVLAVWLVRRALRRAAPPPEVRTSQTSDELVRCVQCGVLLPRAEARMAAGALYCSDEHARLGPLVGPGKR
jgi:uncharacterized protein